MTKLTEREPGILGQTAACILSPGELPGLRHDPSGTHCHKGNQTGRHPLLCGQRLNNKLM